MYYEEMWANGKLFWRSTPKGEWIEADAAKLNYKLRECQDDLRALRIAAQAAVARFDELARDLPSDSAWHTAGDRRFIRTRDMLQEMVNG